MTRDLNGGGESRPTGQFVGGGPAELEQRADVTDADQFIGVSPFSPGGFWFMASRDLMVLRERHSLRRTGGVVTQRSYWQGVVACQ